MSNVKKSRKLSYLRMWFERNFNVILILPLFSFLFVSIFYPLFWNLKTSLYSWILGSESVFVGFGNYITLMQDPRFWHSLKITLYLTVGTLILQLSIGLGVSLLLNKNIKGKNLFRTIALMPMVIAPVVTGLIWGTLFYNPSYGLFNYLLSLFGQKSLLWTYSPDTALLSVMLAITWEWTPFVIITFLAGLESLPKEPFEAAVIDGASRLKVFRYITLPLLKPVIIVVLILRLMDTIKAFDIIVATTFGGPGDATETFNIMTYLSAFVHFNMGYASTQAMMLFLLSLILVVIVIRTTR